jgi:hypothetical protein
MSNKFVVLFVLLLIASMIFNYIQIDNRMGLLKAQNSVYLMGMVVSWVGIIFCLVVFRFNSINKIIKNAKE